MVKGEVAHFSACNRPKVKCIILVMRVGWNIIKSKLNGFSKDNLVSKGGLNPYLQCFKCGNKGGVWLQVP
jgi:hypothetical protein